MFWGHEPVVLSTSWLASLSNSKERVYYKIHSSSSSSYMLHFSGIPGLSCACSCYFQLYQYPKA